MKIAISAQQIVHFRKFGRVSFEEIPLDMNAIAKHTHKTTPTRDLWRSTPALKKWILRTLGPIALELTGRPRLRLACDQTIYPPLPESPLQDLFCFQGLACICVLSQNPESPEQNPSLDIFEPSCLTSWISPNASYLVALAVENSLIINNPQDPLTLPTRNLGYVFGDHLRNELHPLILRS